MGFLRKVKILCHFTTLPNEKGYKTTSMEAFCKEYRLQLGLLHQKACATH